MGPDAHAPSALLLYGFLGLLVVTLGLALWGVSRAAGAKAAARVALGLAIWMATSGALAATGVLSRWDLRPPPFLILPVVGLAGVLLFCRSNVGRSLALGTPLAGLIGFQAFRIPLELLLHRAHVDGVMPVQMSFEGLNFDIVSGVFAAALALYARGRDERYLSSIVWVFNLVGLGLLFNIVAVAIASTPMFAAFGSDRLNTWVATLPFVWLPAIFVLFALTGHLLSIRRLLSPEPRVAGETIP